jgi:hypothetical protein
MTVLTAYTRYSKERIREVIKILEDTRRRILELGESG